MACDVCQGRGSHACPVCGETKVIPCPNCDGYGYVNCVAYKIDSEETFDVSPSFFDALPSDEEHAHFRDDKLYQGECERCHFCEGSGNVFQLEDGSYLPVN